MTSKKYVRLRNTASSESNQVAREKGGLSSAVFEPLRLDNLLLFDFCGDLGLDLFTMHRNFFGRINT
jgi:hypothetical protein